MRGKHHQSPFALLSRHRYPAAVLIVLLCIAVAGVFAAIANRHESDPPLLIVPAQTVLPSPVLISPWSVPASPSAAPSPSPSRSRSPKPSPRPSAKTSAPPRPAFTAQYQILNGRRSTFLVAIVVQNTGSATHSWKVVVTHDPAAGVRVQGARGAKLSTSGNTITLTGDPLGAGKSITVGFQATRTSGETVRPASCTIEGRACTVTAGRYRNESSTQTR